MSRMPDDGDIPLPEPPDGRGQWWFAVIVAVLLALGVGISLLA